MIDTILSEEDIQHYEREGYLVIPGLLTEADLEPPKRAMEEKVSQIANKLFESGLIQDKLENRPFEFRLAELSRI